MSTVKYTPPEIVDIIKVGGWKHKKDFQIDKFVSRITPTEYAIDGRFILQSKLEAVDYDFVDRQVRRAQSGKYFPNDAVIVYFPEETVIDDQVIPSNSYRLIDRTHGMVIDKYIGKNKKKCNRNQWCSKPNEI